jgi:hypothetical protein
LYKSSLRVDEFTLKPREVQNLTLQLSPKEWSNRSSRIFARIDRDLLAQLDHVAEADSSVKGFKIPKISFLWKQGVV